MGYIFFISDSNYLGKKKKKYKYVHIHSSIRENVFKKKISGMFYSEF